MDGCEEPAEENGDPHGAEEQVTAATAAGEVRQGLRKRRPAAATARNQLQFGSRALLAAAKRRARGTRCGERRRAGPGGARGWHDTLPNELVGEVLARLPTRSYLLASRLVCHTWNRLVLSYLAELPCCIVMCQFEPEGLPEVSADEYWRRLKEVGCQRAISIDTRTCEQREIKLPLSFDHLSYTSGKWGLIILDNEEDCYWVGNPLTSAWRAIPYPFDPGSIHTRFAFVVNSETGCYNIVVFYMSVPSFENRELEEGTMWTHIFDSKSCKWREGPSWAGCFSGSWLETWVFNGLVYFSYRPRYQHLEL